jgi:hypothetical protein
MPLPYAVAVAVALRSRRGVLGAFSFAALAALATACGTSASPGEGDLADGAAPDATTSTSPPGSDGGTGAVDSAAPLHDATTGPLTDAPTTTPFDAFTPVTPEGGSCGYMDAGVALHVATGLDVCLPHVACNAETCPPPLADCVNDACVFRAGYSGVATLPEAWVTYYCDLSAGGCRGITQVQYPEVTAQQIATARGLQLCDQATGGTAECVGISAAPAMIVGNSQEAIDSQSGKPVTDWGQGLTEASGLCYELTGPGGTILVAMTDRCGGYCECNGSGFEECGPCVNATDMQVQCPCVGTAPPAYTACCGATCGGTLNPTCDWCASNNHPHFDLDNGSFNRICGSLATQGSCQLSGVRFVSCPEGKTAWPP